MITQGHGLDKRPVSSQERARERLCDEKLMEDPSRDRLDVLLDRARAVFESKYGKSTDCFAAFSPAKVNLMGDFIESSGGLVLQVTLDRRVVVFGRGQSLPEYRPAIPGAVGEGREPGPHESVGHSESDRHVHRHHGHGDAEGDGELDNGGVILSPVPKWRAGKPTGTSGKAAMVDSMVQNLVFGKKHRRTTIAPTDSSATSPASVARTTSPLPSASIRSTGAASSNGGVEDMPRKMSWSSTPNTSRHDSSASGHGSSRFTAHVENNLNHGGPPPKRSIAVGGFNVPPIQIQEVADMSSAPATGEGEGGSCGSVGSGSTTTEEAFPNDTNSIYHSTRSDLVGEDDRLGGRGRREGSGRGRALGKNGAEGGVTPGSSRGDKGRGVSPETSRVRRSSSRSLDGRGGVGDRSRLHCRDLSTIPAGSSLSLDGRVDAEHEEGPEYAEVSGHGPLAPEEEIDGALRASGLRDGDEADHSDDEELYYATRSSDVPDSVYATASTTVGGGDGGRHTPERFMRRPASEPAIKCTDGDEPSPVSLAAAKARAAEAEAIRLRTSRIFCEACPKDGVVEFSAVRGMRGGGDSWQGLITAIAAEYIEEVTPGEMLALEAVVVSDLPGSQCPESPGSAKGRPENQEGVGHGWGETARAALLMASATFLEEILEMRSFPRMKALRCFSAALRCRRMPGQMGNRRSWAVAASKPFSSEEALAQRWDKDGEGGRSGSGGESKENSAGMSLEDLLAIADVDPPGAVLVDSKNRSYWPVPMRGPADEGLAIVIAQPLDVEMVQKLRWQAEDERAKGAATCQAVITVARERHPEASTLRDVPPETLEALISVGSVRGQGKGSAAAAAAANESWWLAGGGGSGSAGGGGGGSPRGMGGSGGWGGHGQGHRVGGALARRKLTPEVLAHARHLAAEVQRVREVAAAFTVGDMEAVGRLMLHSRRSAGLSITGSRGRPEPPEPAAARLAAMASRLPGVHGSRQSEGSGTGAAGAVVALVDPESVEGVLRAISARGMVATGVAWGGFAARPGGGSGIVRNV